MPGFLFDAIGSPDEAKRNLKAGTPTITPGRDTPE
jgi:hypothetical protein